MTKVFAVGRLDEGGPGTNSDDPLPYSLCDELRGVVRANMAGYTTQDEQVRQGVDDVGRVELAIDADRQAFPGELVDDVEHAELPIMTVRKSRPMIRQSSRPYSRSATSSSSMATAEWARLCVSRALW